MHTALERSKRGSFVPFISMPFWRWAYRPTRFDLNCKAPLRPKVPLLWRLRALILGRYLCLVNMILQDPLEVARFRRRKEERKPGSCWSTLSLALKTRLFLPFAAMETDGNASWHTFMQVRGRHHRHGRLFVCKRRRLLIVCRCAFVALYLDTLRDEQDYGGEINTVTRKRSAFYTRRSMTSPPSVSVVIQRTKASSSCSVPQSSYRSCTARSANRTWNPSSDEGANISKTQFRCRAIASGRIPLVSKTRCTIPTSSCQNFAIRAWNRR